MSNGYQSKESKKNCYNCINCKGCIYLQFITPVESHHSACAYWEPIPPTTGSYEDAKAIKDTILTKINDFKHTYGQPRYALISESQFMCLNTDLSIYLDHSDVKGSLIHYVYGLEVCVSNRIKSLEDIEIY